MTIPDKIYFKIGEVAKLADVPSHVLRYWETEFPTITPKRTNSGQRLYRKDDVLFILQIKELLHLKGYTIAGARKYLENDEVEKIELQEQTVTNNVEVAPQVIPQTCEATDHHYRSQKLKNIKDELLSLKELLNK